MTTINYYSELITAQKKLVRDDKISVIKDIPSARIAEVATYYLSKSIISAKSGLISTSTTTSICCSIGDALASYLEPASKFRLGYTSIYPLIKEGVIESTNKYEKREKNDRSKMFKNYHLIKSNSIKFQKDPSKIIRIKDQEFIKDLISYAPDHSYVKPEAEMFRSAPQDWNGFYNSQLGKLINHCNKDVESMFNEFEHKRLFETINKLQSTALEVNSKVLRVVINKEDVLYDHTFDDENQIYRLGNENVSKKSLSGKLKDIDETINQAIKAEGAPFFPAVKPEFRGRLNYCLPYLNYGGGDLAKGLIRSAKGAKLGVNGWDSLLISAMNHLGYDKYSRDAKLEKADESLDDIIQIGSNPYKFDDWMSADKPVQYLAHCIEIADAVKSGDEYNFVSKVLTGVDQATSGPAHIGTATQDYNTLFYTNLISGKDRQDLYLAVGQSAKFIIDETISAFEGEYSDPNDSIFKQALWYARNEDDAVKVAMDAFRRVLEDDPKFLRSVSKRPVMIIGYSAEEWCVAEAIWDDYHAQHEWMNPAFCKKLADIICKAYGDVLPACKQFMQGMKKLAGMIHETGEHLFIKSRWDNFPLMHNYFAPKQLDVRVPDLNNKSGKSDYSIRYFSDKVSYTDSVSGIAPNLIHGLGDALLLRKTVHDFQHPIVINHDGFYCLAAHYDELLSQLRINQTLMATEFNIIDTIVDNYKHLQVSEYEVTKNITKTGKNAGKSYTTRKKIGSHQFTVDDLDIKINDIHPDFDPLNNEFCFS